MESGERFGYNIRMMSMIRVKDIGLLRASCKYFVRTLSVSEGFFSNHGLRILRVGMHVVKSRPQPQPTRREEFVIVKRRDCRWRTLTLTRYLCSQRARRVAQRADRLCPSGSRTKEWRNAKKATRLEIGRGRQRWRSCSDSVVIL